MNRLISTALVLSLAFASSADPMASQRWTSNRIEKAVSGIYSNVYTKQETEAKIVELAPSPGNYGEVSNKAMTAVQSLQPAYDYTDSSISTGNEAFVSAVLDCPVRISQEDGETIGQFGTYGTIGALLAALAAAITWLKNKASSTDDALALKANLSDLPYELASKAPVSGTVTLSDRAVNLVSPNVTELPASWEWSDGLDHGQPVYGVIYDYVEYQDYGWGFKGEGDTLSETDSLGHYLGYAYDGPDATELSFYDYSTDEPIVASLVTNYETDVSSLALPPAVAGKSRDFMVRLAMPENAAMFSWPSGVDYETENGQMPDVSEPGVYLLAFTETGAGRFALMCRKVKGVE